MVCVSFLFSKIVFVKPVIYWEKRYEFHRKRCQICSNINNGYRNQKANFNDVGLPIATTCFCTQADKLNKKASFHQALHDLNDITLMSNEPGVNEIHKSLIMNELTSVAIFVINYSRKDNYLLNKNHRWRLKHFEVEINRFLNLLFLFLKKGERKERSSTPV